MKYIYKKPTTRIWDFEMETFLKNISVHMDSSSPAQFDADSKDRNLPVINMDSEDDW